MQHTQTINTAATQLERLTLQLNQVATFWNNDSRHRSDFLRYRNTSLRLWNANSKSSCPFQLNITTCDDCFF